jgi:hypothetical protein
MYIKSRPFHKTKYILVGLLNGLAFVDSEICKLVTVPAFAASCKIPRKVWFMY